MCFDIGIQHLGAGAKTRLQTPKAVAYHEEPDYCRFMIGHSLGRMESGIKGFTPHYICICRPRARAGPPECVSARYITPFSARYITAVSAEWQRGGVRPISLDATRALYALYGVQYIGLVSLAPRCVRPTPNHLPWVVRPMLRVGQI